MKTTTFAINNTSKNYTFPIESTNYSKILDDIIATNIINSNPYLKNTKKENTFTSTIFINNQKKNHCDLFSSHLNNENAFAKAANFIANYNKNIYTNTPFIIGKTYKLINGTPICFFDDEIQIGMDLYSYEDFKNITFLKTISKPKKDIIINIFNAYNKDIEINII